jgi:secreted trypsin-like serine protease
MHTRKTKSSLLTLLLILALVLFAGVPKAQAQDDPPPPTVVPEIVGGAPAAPGEWPWQVALVQGAATGPNYWTPQFCGGSLIHPQWVLTAAHCISLQNGGVTSPANVDIVAGIYNLASPAAGYQQRNVTQIIRHPSYNPNTFDFDIALLRLQSAVTIGGSGAATTALVPLVPANIGSLAGTNSWVTGWGNTESVPMWPTELHEVQVPIIDNTVCNNGSHYGGSITANMLCAGFDAGGHDSCQGDSGGPLVVSNGGQWKLGGIVSWGSGCADPFRQGVYTRVSQFGGWVNKNIGLTTLGSPSGNIGTNYNPTYTWDAVPTMTHYYLWVNAPSGPGYIKQWFTAAAAGCAGGTGTCSATASRTLGGGAHTWYIQTWNPAGYGPWTPGKAFSTTIPPAPGAANLVSPNGNITDTTPTYTWNAVSGASHYYLWVNAPTGNGFIKQWYLATNVCSGGTCSVEHPTALKGGAHAWYIRTWNSTGYGPWSAAMNFMVNPPGAATPGSPNGNIIDTSPTYTWNVVAGATHYYLWVNAPSGNGFIKQWYLATNVCSGGTCSVTPAPNHALGAHTWFLRTWSSAGYGPWSSGQAFNITP